MDNVQEKEAKARRRFFSVWTAIGAIFLIGVVGFVLGVLATPMAIIAWTCIFVFCLRTPVAWFESKGINRAIGTAFAYVIMFVVLFVLGVIMFSPAFGIGGQFQSLIDSLPSYISSIVDSLNNLYTQYSYLFENETVKEWLNELTKALGSWASAFAQASAGGIVSAGSMIANSFVAIGFALVVAFWILMDLPNLGRECWRLISDKRKEDAQMLYVTFTRIMGGYIKATLVQCLLIGVGCGIAFAIIGVPYYAALGAITGLLNIIPVVGPWLGGALAAIIGFFVSPWIAVVALVVTIVIQQFVYTFISPKLMSNSVDIHPALVIIALMAGSAVGGTLAGLLGSVIGMLASIPLVAVAKALFVYHFEKRTGRQIVSEDGVFFKGAPVDESSRASHDESGPEGESEGNQPEDPAGSQEADAGAGADAPPNLEAVASNEKIDERE